MTEATARIDTNQAELCENVTAEQVRAYLSLNPNFFEDNPSTLTLLRIPHDETGNSVSLIERQVRRLQQQNQELQQRLNQLVGVAHENQQRLTQLQALQLRLISAKNQKEFKAALSDSMKNEFDCDIVSIKLYSPKQEPAFASADDLPSSFAAFKEQGQAHCGRLRQEQLDWLFADQAGEIGSAALIPLNNLGLLALGSKEEQRFAPDQGTAFLDHLGQLCTLLLERHTKSS